MKTFIFPGQGSQKKGMGKKLFDEFYELTSKADAILGYSIKELCLEDHDGRLNQTQFTQPALYVINALSYLSRIKNSYKKPDYVSGHSLGEYSSLFASGVFDFETGLSLVKKRGELMSNASGGGMAAIIGLTEEKVEEVLNDNGQKSIDIANINSPHQIVISGPKEDIFKAQKVFEASGVERYTLLNVSGAFHSRYMEDAKKAFEEFLDEFEFHEPNIPVISNVDARPYKKEKTKELLANQLTCPVKWMESIRYLIGKGEMKFDEVGPGTILTGLIQDIKKDGTPLFVNEEGRQSKDKIWHDQSRVTEINALSLGDKEFKNDYKIKYAYVSGGMYRGIASEKLIVRMGKTGLIGYFGTGGLKIRVIEEAIQYIQKELSNGQAYGMNLLNNLANPQIEEDTVYLFLHYGVRNIEAAAYLQVSPALVQYRLNGLTRDLDGRIVTLNKIMAKVSRPEIAEVFLSPAPSHLVERLFDAKKITQEEAELAKEVPMASDICVEADSGGHTDGGVAYVLMPAILKLRDEMMNKYKYGKKVRIGSAGGIGTPEAAAAAFILGAEFILTGSINQCTVEAGTSDIAKDLLQQMNVPDTTYAPAGDMFEIGAKVQILRKGTFFPTRANKLYELYRRYNSLDEIEEKTKKQLQEKYFMRSFNDIFEETKSFFKNNPKEIEKAERNPKHKMALVFRWYLNHGVQLALEGKEEHKVDYQIHCGPALGAFNQWTKGTEIESWKNRHVDEIAERIMHETAKLLTRRYQSLISNIS